MFEFKNNHKTQVEINSESSRENAVKYIEKMVDAFETLRHIETLLGGIKITKRGDSDCVVTTAQIEGKDFRPEIHPWRRRRSSNACPAEDRSAAPHARTACR